MDVVLDQRKYNFNDAQRFRVLNDTQIVTLTVNRYDNKELNFLLISIKERDEHYSFKIGWRGCELSQILTSLGNHIKEADIIQSKMQVAESLLLDRKKSAENQYLINQHEAL